jgi:hypothetical protein
MWLRGPIIIDRNNSASGVGKMRERRISAADRRQASASSEDLPLVDDKGELVELERRNVPDRRLDNISVEEIDCRDYIHLVAAEKKD